MCLPTRNVCTYICMRVYEEVMMTESQIWAARKRNGASIRLAPIIWTRGFSLGEIMAMVFCLLYVVVGQILWKSALEV